MPSEREILTGQRRWLLHGVTPGEQETLFGPTGLRLPEWLKAGQAEVVKHAPYRTVYRVRLGLLDLHVKYYRGDLREWCRQQMRGSRAWREYSLSREVAARGVPTLEMLVCGESIHRWGAADSYIVTRTLPGVESLLDFLLDRLPELPWAAQRIISKRLATALGECLARIHLAGVCHEDLHPGNLLVRDPEGHPELFLIDLPYAKIGEPLDWARARENLVMLDRWFALRSGAGDRRRAWSAYCRSRTDLHLDERRCAEELSRLTETTLRTSAAGLDHRCLGGNRHFRKVNVRGVVGHVVSDLTPEVFNPILTDGDQLFNREENQPLKRSKSSAVVATALPVAGAVRQVIAKRINGVWSDPFASLFRTPAALRSYCLGHALRLRGLPTPRPLAVWHRGWFGLFGTGYLLLEKVPQAVRLDVAVKDLVDLPDRLRTRARQELLAETAALIRKLHGFHFTHRDLKASNLLVSPQGYRMGARDLREGPGELDNPEQKVWLIDLVGMRQGGPPSFQRKIRDLARLHVSFCNEANLSRADRLRFLLLYLRNGLAIGPDEPANWKVWWKGIDRLARAKIRRNQRRGRVIS